MKEVNVGMPVGLYEHGWIMPYLPGKSSIDELASVEMDIFKRTKRVVLDANRDNIVNGFLIDPDMALRPGSPASNLYYPDLESTDIYKKRVAKECGDTWSEDQQLENWLNE